MTMDLLTPTPAVPGYPAAFSPCRRYRYALWRHWGATTDPRYLMVIGLNPSTADETNDDPTIRRCIRFAKDWGFDALCMTNLFAFRATDPAVMKAATDPFGADNLRWLADLGRGAGMVLAAWGVHGSFADRAAFVQRVLWESGVPPLHALGTTKDGHPRHPLYMPVSARPQPYAPLNPEVA